MARTSTGNGLAAGSAVPDTDVGALDGNLAAEGAVVLGVLGDFHLLHLLTQGSTVSDRSCQCWVRWLGVVKSSSVPAGASGGGMLRSWPSVLSTTARLPLSVVGFDVGVVGGAFTWYRIYRSRRPSWCLSGGISHREPRAGAVKAALPTPAAQPNVPKSWPRNRGVRGTHAWSSCLLGVRCLGREDVVKLVVGRVSKLVKRF